MGEYRQIKVPGCAYADILFIDGGYAALQASFEWGEGKAVYRLNLETGELQRLHQSPGLEWLAGDSISGEIYRADLGPGHIAVRSLSSSAAALVPLSEPDEEIIGFTAGAGYCFVKTQAARNEWEAEVRMYMCRMQSGSVIDVSFPPLADAFRLPVAVVEDGRPYFVLEDTIHTPYEAVEIRRYGDEAEARNRVIACEADKLFGGGFRVGEEPHWTILDESVHDMYLELLDASSRGLVINRVRPDASTSTVTTIDVKGKLIKAARFPTVISEVAQSPAGEVYAFWDGEVLRCYDASAKPLFPTATFAPFPWLAGAVSVYSVAGVTAEGHVIFDASENLEDRSYQIRLDYDPKEKALIALDCAFVLEDGLLY